MDATRFPSFRETEDALRVIARVLERDLAYLLGSTYHFVLEDDWSVAATPESARRFRLELWRHGRERATIWASVTDTPRLESVVSEMAAQVFALA